MTVIEPPAWPSFAVEVADADGEAELRAVAPELAELEEDGRTHVHVGPQAEGARIGRRVKNRWR